MDRICVVEDESSLADMIRLNLEMEGYSVDHFSNGLEASNHLDQDTEYNLIILDVMLPGMNGVDICKRLRTHSEVPVIFLSAKGTTTDRIDGLKAGGNDYLPKPFDLEELLLRVAVLAQGNKKEEVQSNTLGDFEINYKTFSIVNKKTDQAVNISKKEVGLLQLFFEREGEVVSRSEILDRVWGKDQFPTTRTIDNYILNFRKIFEENPKEPKYFHSIRGVGYKFTK